MITPRPLLWEIISVLVLSNESVSDLLPGGENQCLIHFDVDALGNGGFKRFNGIPFHHQSGKNWWSTYFIKNHWREIQGITSLNILFAILVLWK